MSDDPKALIDRISSNRPRFSRMKRTARSDGSAAESPRRPPKDPVSVTDDPLGRAIYAKGWSITEAAERWGYTPSYLYRLLKAKKRSRIWDDAARGMPKHDDHEHELRETAEKLDSVDNIIKRIRGKRDHENVQIHVFDTTGRLALPDAITSKPTLDAEHGSGLAPFIDTSSQHDIQRFVMTLMAWSSMSGQQESNVLCDIISYCHEYSYKDQDKAGGHSGLGISELLGIITRSLFQDNLFANQNRLILVKQQLNEHRDLNEIAPQLIPKEHERQVKDLSKARKQLDAALLSYSSALSENQNSRSFLSKFSIEQRIDLCNQIQRLLGTGFFHAPPLPSPSDANFLRYDISSMSDLEQRTFTLFRINEIMSKSPSGTVIFLDDAPILPGTSYRTILLTVDRHFD